MRRFVEDLQTTHHRDDLVESSWSWDVGHDPCQSVIFVDAAVVEQES
jgi:hypothetical protein